MAAPIPTPTPTAPSVKNKNKVDMDLAEKVLHLKINEGTSDPFSLTTPFESFDIPEELIKKLYEEGFKEPTPIQARSWPVALQGRDVIAVAKSGSGKKLGFLLPGFVRLKRLQNNPESGPTVLVLCPTDDSATQVQTEAMKFGASAGIKTTCLNREAMNSEVLRTRLGLEEWGDVLVAIPELLIKILNNGKLSLKQIAYLVVCETDVLFSASIVPLIQEILLHHMPSKQYCQTLVFTTTWPRVDRGINSVLHNPVTVTVGDITSTSSDITNSASGSEVLFVSGNALVRKELMPPAKKKLLVLDINGILADIVMLDSRKLQKADFTVKGKSVFKRPCCADFLMFCFANFEVGIWSSRNKDNLLQVVDYLIGDLKHKLLFFWDQSKCTTIRNLKARDNKYKSVFFKELNKLWGKEEPGLPWQKGRFTKTNTLLVDDSPYKALRNPLFTAIFPDPYNFKNKEDKSLGVEGDLRLYLEKLVTAEDVQSYVKNNPFGQPPMTESHPDWKYYLPAMRTWRRETFD